MSQLETDEYEINPNIEKWFMHDQGANSGNNKQTPVRDIETFFTCKNLPFIFYFFELFDLIMLAGAYKSIAYRLYNKDILGFRTFCDQIWLTGILDLRTYTPTCNQLESIITMFNPKTLFFPITLKNA